MRMDAAKWKMIWPSVGHNFSADSGNVKNRELHGSVFGACTFYRRFQPPPIEALFEHTFVSTYQRAPSAKLVHYAWIGVLLLRHSRSRRAHKGGSYTALFMAASSKYLDM